jgi:acyl-CoA thioesterase I
MKAMIRATRLGTSAVLVGLLASGTLAQTPPQPNPQSHNLGQPAQAPQAVPSISQECRTPGLAAVRAVPLPNVASALKKRKVISILTIGASSRAGRDVGAGGYYSLIERMLEKSVKGLDVQIYDRGVSGELAADAAQRLMTEVALIKPDLVLWQLGTHDALQQVSVEDFKATVSDTLDWLKAHNVDVVLVGMHYIKGLAKDPHYQAIRRALSEITAAKHVMRIGRYEAMRVIERAKQTGDGGTDEFVLTEEGYSCLAEYVARALTSGLFARTKRRLPVPPGKS